MINFLLLPISLLSISFPAAAAVSSCKPSRALGLEVVKVGGKDAYTNKAKTISLTFSCPDLTAKEVEELLAIFPERIKVDQNVSYHSLRPAGDSIARIYFDTTSQKLIQLAVVTKVPKAGSADVEKFVSEVLQDIRKQ